MEDKYTLEYFLTLLDECERVIDNDNFAEKKQISFYHLETKKEEAKEVKDDDISLCHECQAWRNRIKYAQPLRSKECKLMCILPSPEGSLLLLPDSNDYFKKWCMAIGLEQKDVTLTSLIKCPSNVFSKEYADICKSNLRAEMQEDKPRAILLLGQDVANYMLRRNLNIENLRGRRYLINNIPTFVTYSPRDLVNNRALRAPIWEDLKLLREAL